jgi:hypothetical protein
MKANSLPMLESWKRAADPVEGIREALRYFGLIRRQPVELANRLDSALPPIANPETRPANFSPAGVLAQSQNIPRHPGPQSQT